MNRDKNKKILVAMSGGADSAVAALLLKNQGYSIAGITMYFRIDTLNGRLWFCREAVEKAKKICDKLGIEHYTIDVSQEFEKKIVSKFISEYLKGRTPNPCIECNRKIKFGILLEKARDMGFTYLATGHYAQIENYRDNYFLKKAKDSHKDQSYFLYSIKKEYLKYIILPLANLNKERTKAIALKFGLPYIADQSQNICFAKDDYRKFLMQRIEKNKIKYGKIVDTKGKNLGMHKGIFSYTIGQREKLGVNLGYPVYVRNIDRKENKIIIGKREELLARGLVADRINLLVDNLPRKAKAKIRYHHKESLCELYLRKKKVEVIFAKRQFAVTPGQSVVFYEGNIVLGGGVIKEIIW